MVTDDEVDYPPYTPMPSLGHELGIMFGFIGICVLSIGIYLVFWQAAHRRIASRELARSEELRALGIHHERGGIHDKMLSRYARPPDRADFLGPGDLHSSSGANISATSIPTSGPSTNGNTVRAGPLRDIL